MATITPVILAGGSGTRLWPLSRQSYPKQFARLAGDQTMFKATVQRFATGNASVSFAPPVILTNADFRFIITEQLAEAGIDPGAILIEPSRRNTAPAILAAALHLAQTDPEALMLVAPSDHVMGDTGQFLAAIAQGLPAVAAGDLVTFGITPDRAETAYGYLELSQPAADAAVRLTRFIEKPDFDAAERMVATGTHLWNAGIFLFAAKDIIAAFRAHAAALLEPVQAALTSARPDLGFLRLDAIGWADAPDISIDYAVMEHAPNLSVVPYAGGWSDLGGWDAVWRAGHPDANGVVARGNAAAIDCENTLLRSEAASMQIVGIGLSNIVAIAMPDAVLVVDMSRVQDVKQAVALLTQRGAQQAEKHPRDHRPWGWFESLVTGDRFQVKRIVVHPGAALSLQSHIHRSEHWIVVEGTAEVTIDGTTSLIAENQSAYIPAGATHRMRNPGRVPVVLIEVQTGAYVGEDDIIRYDDAYARQ